MLVSMFPASVLAVSDEEGYTDIETVAENGGEAAGQYAGTAEGEEKDAEPEEPQGPDETEEPQEPEE